ncbi:MAG: glycoside hydrolase family 65 protein [Bacteroidetes bacterium]|jgi:trehalose/maltose hydrolase-like predicted phosphorylase|nr:glycoside hydrolase family 65 protein [Bacteroidota bacterium]MBT4402204.1 glycoside hydrolase family 65 protein [Bacteroidota bacterium]MBT4410755.1 glycoside hydrolase family 65 protein [Bacteroidota bacterium]MBT7465292.1 glycoside hydrolase family 65 protein [Bacteroidota bacterium]
MPETFNELADWKEWSLSFNDFDPSKEKSRESLLAVGNGYLGVRGAMEESCAGDIHYPGIYVAGLYNRLVSKVAGRDIENEDFVNCPNFLNMQFRVNGDDWFSITADNLVSVSRELDFKSGVLQREMLVRTDGEKLTRIISRRLASMTNPHLLAHEYIIEPINHSGTFHIRSLVDGTLINDGVARYRSLNQKHLEAVDEGQSGDIAWLKVQTTQSQIEITEAVKHQISLNNEQLSVDWEYQIETGRISAEFSVLLKQNQSLSIHKTAVLYTSKPDDVTNPLKHCLDDLVQKSSFDAMVKENIEKWKDIWTKIDIRITGDTKSQALIRLHLYHLIVTASSHNIGIDAGIPARGLHGEAYRGHIFWDELYILPLYNLFLPDVARSILQYRYRRLDQARSYAKEYGYKGAMFPWQSGSDGREETQTVHLNPVSGKWGDDYSSLQRHISIAIAYNTWYYYQISDDNDFMIESGAELYLEICRFWASKCALNEKTGRFEIAKVMGPDEFHEEHPNSPGGGVKDNAYTNIMVAWLFKEAVKLVDKLPDKSVTVVLNKLNLGKEELESWKLMSIKLNMVISPDGVLAQFDGYFELEELDWDAYRSKYNSIYRLDRILKAEGKSPDDYKLAKQADTLMSFYNLDEDMIKNILVEMGYDIGNNFLRANYDYYINRTSHGSTLSRVVHAYLANQLGDPEKSWELYSEALASDYSDIQGGTTAEGIHAGVMGGTVLMAITCFAGINLKHKELRITPNLPSTWQSLAFEINFKGLAYKLVISKSELEILVKSHDNKQTEMFFNGKKIILSTNSKQVIQY